MSITESSLADPETSRELSAHASTLKKGILAAEEGPTGWRKHFADSPSFFMALDGHLVYPTGAAAMAAILNLAHAIKHIELRWGDDPRVDPLAADFAVVATSWREATVDAAGKGVEETGYFTGIAEHRNGCWQFRSLVRRGGAFGPSRRTLTTTQPSNDGQSRVATSDLL